MNEYQRLSHTTWDCKYELVWIPKYRKKVIYGQLRKHLGDILREFALRKDRGYLVSSFGRDKEKVRRYISGRKHI